MGAIRNCNKHTVKLPLNMNCSIDPIDIFGFSACEYGAIYLKDMDIQKRMKRL
jgi:hypothetical protein